MQFSRKEREFKENEKKILEKLNSLQFDPNLTLIKFTGQEGVNCHF